MPKGVRIREKDKQALRELVIEEVEQLKRGEIDYLSTNAELAELIGISGLPDVIKYLKTLPEEYRTYRRHANEARPKVSESDKHILLDLILEELVRAPSRNPQAFKPEIECTSS